MNPTFDPSLPSTSTTMLGFHFVGEFVFQHLVAHPAILARRAIGAIGIVDG